MTGTISAGRFESLPAVLKLLDSQTAGSGNRVPGSEASFCFHIGFILWAFYAALHPLSKLWGKFLNLCLCMCACVYACMCACTCSMASVWKLGQSQGSVFPFHFLFVCLLLCVRVPGFPSPSPTSPLEHGDYRYICY